MFNEALLSDVEVFSLAHHGERLSLSDDFVLREFASKQVDPCTMEYLYGEDGKPLLEDIVLVHPNLVLGLQYARDHFGKRVTLTSGFRTKWHHMATYKKIGGKIPWGSKHLWGMAADIEVEDVEPSDVADYLEELDFGGIGRYDTFTHADVAGWQRRWGPAM